ncbi:4-hydroxy-tetrahydrodipicolinate synthase [Peptostreptococcus canis]|nr:4-hydroxy-tetrahydrodipicolinate synthase [Peptostreptococcus canis]MBP1997387.1 4-hydroxy-tetrahydrodipicolinate synthase [Peptostreptococcus canis]
MLRGLGINVITPFLETNEIDFENIERQVDTYINNGADFIVIGRNTGEFYTMDDNEIISVIETVAKRVNKRIPVIAQTGFNDTSRSIKLSIKAKLMGIDGIILSPPYYNIGNEQGLLSHYKSISMAANLPCYIENDPEKSGVNISHSLLMELSEIKNIVGVIENSSDIKQYIDIKSNSPYNFEIICANDSLLFPSLSLGATGVISTVANIYPDIISRIINNFDKGNISVSRDIYFGMLKINEVLTQEVNPVPIKTAMNMLGYEVGDFRLPLGSMNPDKAAKLATLLMDEKIHKL